MGKLLYQISIFMYGAAVRLVSFFNPKAKLFIAGRKNIWAELSSAFPKNNVVWFHAASLGEFEQGKPVMELLKKKHPEINLLVTFFSPSGYEERKDYPLADVFYLPLDTPKNARKFLDITQPKMAVFVRYEFWANYLSELYQRNIFTAVMAAQFRENQFAFGPFGGYVRKHIKNLDAILVQYKSAQQVLLQHNFAPEKIAVCGDSRFDRVLDTVSIAEEIESIKTFKGDSPLLVLGSCYKHEEDFVKAAFAKFPEWKFLYAPHFVDEKHIAELHHRLPEKAENFTDFKNEGTRILVLNTIGKLAAAYRYADIAVVGGGFRDGIHNILEPAAFGAPVFFGPNHEAFPEADALLNENLAFEIDKSGAAEKQLFKLMEDAPLRKTHREKLRDFVKNHAGATEKIVSKIEALFQRSY